MIMENETENLAQTVFKEILNNIDGYSWKDNMKEEIKNGDALALEQEVFGLDTLNTDETYISK